MRSCLHTYRTKTNLTQHIIQPLGGPSAKYGGGHQPTMGGHQPSMGGVINQLWGGHQPSMGGVINQLWGGISQVWGGIFPPVCTGSQNPENYFSNTYVLPSVNRTAGPTRTPPFCRQASYTPTEYHYTHFCLSSKLKYV